MIEIIFSATDDKEITQYLEILGQRLRDRTPIMRRIAETMKDRVEENFEQQGRPTKWTPLSQKTKEARARKGHWPGKILQVSGKLAKVSRRADNNQAIVTSGMPYAAAQHFGFDGVVSVRAHSRRMSTRDVVMSSLKAKNKLTPKVRTIATGVAFVKAHNKHMHIPARPFMKLLPEDIEQIKQEVKIYVIGKR